MSKLKKTIISLLAPVIYFMFIILLFLIPIFVAKKTHGHNEQLVGEKILIDGDTLAITKYYGGIFYISNGIEIDADNIDKFLIKK